MLRRLLVMLVGGLTVGAGGDLPAGGSCGDCHGNVERMTALGSPRLTVTQAAVRAQNGMKAVCPDCHRGDPAAPGSEEAHQGLLQARLVRKGWQTVTRSTMPAADAAGWPTLEPRGTNRATRLLPKREVAGELREIAGYRTLLYHDRNPETLAFNPLLAAETCGRCHAEIVQDFRRSPMGGGAGAHTQSQYVAWTGPAGPQSCGLWVGSLAQPAQERFTDDNRNYYNAHSTRPLTPEAAADSQRKCNVCHVGCLDCHAEPLAPDPANPAVGAHRVVRKPSPLSCYGGGKSLSCHAGPGERRRGDGFIRGEFTQASAAGKKQLRERPDVHFAKKMACVDCHLRNPATSDHADLQRTVDCGRCHEEVVADHRKGPHRRVDCAACHVALIGGYAFNFWTYREEDEVPSPLTRIQDYYTDAVPPLLVRNPQGTWIPVHVIPHTSGNVRAEEVRLSTRLLFRNRPDARIQRRYVSNDAFAVTGLARNVDAADRDVLVWLEVERVAHGLGKARECASCHATRQQRIPVKYETGGEIYQDVENGEYTIIADRQGLRVTAFRGAEGGPPAKGLHPFLDKWSLAGDFSLPPLKKTTRYRKLLEEYGQGRFRH